VSVTANLSKDVLEATRTLKDAVAAVAGSLSAEVAAEVASNLIAAASEAAGVSIAVTEKPATRSRAEKAAQTRADVLAAATRLMARQGYEATSLDAIAKEAGYTKGAIYSHFDSKEQLFSELIQMFVDANLVSMSDPKGIQKPDLVHATSDGVPEDLLLNLELRLFALRHPEKAAPIRELGVAQWRQLARQVHFERHGKVGKPSQSDLDAAVGLVSVAGEGAIWAHLLPEDFDVSGVSERLMGRIIAAE
jgi:AcrR family transcriptional regulator